MLCDIERNYKALRIKVLKLCISNLSKILRMCYKSAKEKTYISTRDLVTLKKI
jgi:hypothetical protein